MAIGYSPLLNILIIDTGKPEFRIGKQFARSFPLQCLEEFDSVGGHAHILVFRVQ